MRQRNSLMIILELVLLFILSETICDGKNLTHPRFSKASSYSVNSFYSCSYITHEGDINISDSETFTIQDCEYNITGKIMLEDNATLIVQNARFITTPSLWGDDISLIVKNQARLLVKNSTVVFHEPRGFDCKIIVQDEAEANITGSILEKWGYVVAHDTSTINIENSNITIGTNSFHNSGVATYDGSMGRIENSIIDGVFVWDTSAASVTNSIVKIIRTCWEESDETVVNITDSRIGTIQVGGGTPIFHVNGSAVTQNAYLHSNTSAWFTDSSVVALRATGNATVWLINSSAGSISLDGDAKVFVGWYLPLFGLVTMPHTWIPIMQIIFITAIVAIIVVLYIVYSKKKKTREKETLHENEIFLNEM